MRGGWTLYQGGHGISVLGSPQTRCYAFGLLQLKSRSSSATLTLCHPIKRSLSLGPACMGEPTLLPLLAALQLHQTVNLQHAGICKLDCTLLVGTFGAVQTSLLGGWNGDIILEGRLPGRRRAAAARARRVSGRA